MYILISVVMAVAPAVYLVRYFYKKDINRPEPKGVIIKVFFWGFISTFPVIIVENIVSTVQVLFINRSILQHLFTAFIVADLCEEYFY